MTSQARIPLWIVAVVARPRLGWRGVHVTVGDPISVSERLERYCRGRQEAKQAVTELTQDVFSFQFLSFSNF